MNKKNIIQIVVIVACFAASGIVIYNNFIKKEPVPTGILSALPPGAVQTDQPILPNGDTFDLDAIKRSTLRFNLIDYPKLNYPSEVGLPKEDILRSITPETANNNSQP